MGFSTPTLCKSLLGVSLLLVQISTTLSQAGNTVVNVENTKVAQICNSTIQSFCTSTDPRNFNADSNCQTLTTIANGTSPQCSFENGCSFMVNINNVERSIFVSFGSLPQGGTVYKNCSNGLIIYGLAY